jgi:membrane fusion protein, multidrug efflux system
MKQFIIFVFAIGLILLYSSCSTSDADTSIPELDRESLPVTVVVEEVMPQTFTDAVRLSGVVKAYESVMLSPEEGGIVKMWKVNKGDTVRKGAIIALLNDDILQANYDAANAQYQLTELNYQKQNSVFEEQGISELQLKTAEYSRDSAKAQADLAKSRLERSRLRSPIDGIIDQRFLEDGEFAPPAVPIAYIVNMDRIKVTAEIPERYAGSISRGSSVTVTFDAFPGDTLTGQIDFAGATVSSSNRTLPIEIVFRNPGGKIKPEMIAKVTITLNSRDNAILIGENVIQRVDRNKHIVYVTNSDTARERVVSLGGRQGNLVEIVDGLKPGDHVVVEGYQKLVDGQRVIVE